MQLYEINGAGRIKDPIKQLGIIHSVRAQHFPKN